MAADPVVDYWTEMMKRTAITPELMAQWKGLIDHSIEAWSRALSEVMATDQFAQLLGASIDHWLAAQASVTGERTQLTAMAAQLTTMAAQLSRLEERVRQVEARLERSRESPPQPMAARTPPRSRRRRAA